MKFDIKVLQGILDQAVESGEECGLQLAIYDHGELAVDICSGFADRERKIEVDRKSLFPIYSCGKGVMAAAFHMLYERGLVDYDAKLADIWPEYGCCGKEETLVWHALTHRAGVNQLPELDSQSDMGNWELMCQKLAAATPSTVPGTVCNYHGITFAWLIGEIANRSSGLDFQEFIGKEILSALGISGEFYFGTDAAADSRLVEVDSAPDGWCRSFISDDAIRHGFVPSANGVATASALAKIYAAAVFGVDGKRLLKDETISNAAILRRHPDDPAGDTWAKFGLGWALPNMPETNAVFGHGGALGGEGFADLEHGITVGFVKNHQTATHPDHPVRNRISEALGLRTRRW